MSHKNVYVIMRRNGDQYENNDDAIIAFLDKDAAEKFQSEANAAWKKQNDKLDDLRAESNESFHAEDWEKFDAIEARKAKLLKTRYDKNIPEDTSGYWIQEVRLAI